MAATPELRPLGDALGTEALGVDLSRLDDDTFDWISNAFAEHPVLVFRNQKLDGGRHRIGFGQRFGCRASMRWSSTGMPNIPDVSWLTNVEEDGSDRLVRGQTRDRLAYQLDL